MALLNLSPAKEALFMALPNTIPVKGIKFSDLKTIDQIQGEIVEGKWSVQVVETPEGKRITVLLKPQIYYKNQPGLEWSDITSISRWNQGETTELLIPTQSGGKAKARFYRAWTQNTFAVVQWYAWLGGGHYDPSVWMSCPGHDTVHYFTI